MIPYGAVVRVLSGPYDSQCSSVGDVVEPAFMLGAYGMLRGENGDCLMPAAGIIARERERMGFVWLGTCEADPRQPGPPTLAWGVLPDDSVMVSVVREYGATSWEPIMREEWGELWPHSNTPAHLPDES